MWGLKMVRPCLVFLMFCAIVFSKGGFETLSTGSDEVMYGMLQRQMMDQMHRGTPQDNPIPRLDHYVTDFAAKNLVYRRTWRRGPDVLSASSAMLFGLSPEQVYPVTFFGLAIALAGSVLFLMRHLFGIRSGVAWPAQLFVLCSAALWTLQMQGNFHDLASWAVFLLQPWFLWRAIHSPRKALFPLALLLSAAFSFYYEPVIISLFVPLVVVVTLELVRRQASLKRIGLVMLLTASSAIALNPFLPAKLHFATVIAVDAGLNTFPTTDPLQRPEQNAIVLKNPLSTLRQSLSGLYQTEWWPYFCGVLAGAFPSIDITRLHQAVREWSFGMQGWGFLSALALAALSVGGWLWAGRWMGLAGAIPLLGWLFAANLFVLQKHFFTWYRASMYLMPFLLVGLALAFCKGRMALTSRSLGARIFGWIGFLAGLVFLSLNVFTSTAVAAYVFQHNLCDDDLIRRTNPNGRTWQQMREILAQSDNPVLISGYSEPPRVLWLASGLRPIAHFLGKSVSDQWPFGAHASPDLPLWPVGNPTELQQWYSVYFTRLSLDELVGAMRRENEPWNKIYPKFLRISQVAVVPPRGGYPVEWPPLEDVVRSARIHYRNIGDIVFRREPAIRFRGDVLGRLDRDDRGLYRWIEPHAVVSWLPPGEVREITLRYDGAPRELTLWIGGEEKSFTETAADGTDTLRARIPGSLRVEFRASRRLKIRELAAVGDPGCSR